MRKNCINAFAVILATTGSVTAQDLASDFDWVSLSAHARVAFGATTGDYEELAAHGHDPNQDFTLQELDLALSLRPSEYFQAFANGILFLDTEDNFDTEWEEGFVKLLNLPGGFEVRGGRYFNRFGNQNNVHLHGWDFVDANLVTSNFLGEEGLITEGGELSWIYQANEVDTIFSLSFGNAVVHDHDEHGEEEDEDEDEEGHGHGGEDAFFADEVLTLRWMLRWQRNDFHQHQFGVNYGVGDNGYGRDSSVWSADYFYNWRENGLSQGGRYFRIGGEVYYRDVEWLDEEETPAETGEQGQYGLVFSMLYGFNECWEAGLRYGWIEGVEDGPDGEVVFETEERKRLSAALTCRFDLADDLLGLGRLQYNYDDLPEGDEHSVFLQFGLDWGGPEIR